jgi:hypothetical protein
MKLFRRALPILGILATTFAFLPTQSLAHDYPHERIYRHMHRRHEQVFRRVPHHIYYSAAFITNPITPEESITGRITTITWPIGSRCTSEAVSCTAPPTTAVTIFS